MTTSRAPSSEEVRLLTELRLHRLASLVPAMSAEDYEGFRADVAERGVVVPLEITAAGIVLDGRHRYEAAHELGLASVPVRVIAPPDELEYMVRAATSRRQLSASQRATMAVKLECYWADRERSLQCRRANLRNQRLERANVPNRGGRSRDRAAKLVGTCGRYVQYAHTLQRDNPELFRQVDVGQLNLPKAMQQLKRARRHAAIGEAPPLPDEPFGLILADPPWQTSNPDSDYAPEQYYPTMPLDELKQLKVPAADDALLYLWVIHAQLRSAFELIDAWGFTHCGDEVWIKDRIGPGVYTRYRHEQILIGRRGNASPPEPKLRLDSVIEAPRGRHSAKPACLYERLEHLYPNRSKLELFARGKPRPGWTAWGNEAETP